MRKTLSVIALLLSLLTVLSFGSVVSYAADSSEETSVEASADVSGESSDDASTDASAESTDSKDESSESKAESTESKTESSASKAESSENKQEQTVSATTSSADKKDDAEKADDDGFKWLPLIIFVSILVILVLVCFICIKKENKFGLWLKKFFKDYKSEIRKIVWASKEFTVKSSIVVIVGIVVCGAVVSLLDFGLTKLILLLIDLMGK